MRQYYDVAEPARAAMRKRRKEVEAQLRQALSVRSPPHPAVACSAVVPRDPGSIPAQIRRAPPALQVRGHERQRAARPLAAAQPVPVWAGNQLNIRSGDFCEDHDAWTQRAPRSGRARARSYAADGPLELQVPCASAAGRVDR